MKNKRIITIDGPSASGKGSLARRLAEALQFLLLDSGLLYRAYTYFFEQMQSHEFALNMLKSSKIKNFEGAMLIFHEEQNITQSLRNEKIAHLASKLSSLDVTRRNLLSLQRELASSDGLVADGRDMGTVVFPHSATKIFLTASSEMRANRRFRELQNIDPLITLDRIKDDIQSRDDADKSRALSPLIPATDAKIVDSTNKTEEEVFLIAMEHFIKCTN